ncbi:MAG: bacteriohemerythrin [Desulfobulbus sp.]|nr:bacteriohemerythrin [Desulfobulbus sp.]
MTIIWNANFETGHRQIDLQHQELVSLINELTAALEAGRELDELGSILPRLNGYVLFHFGTEEMLMSSLPADNPHVVAHCQAHRDFAARINALQTSAAAGEKLGIEPLVALVDFLRNWLVEHIMRTDHELIALLALHPPLPLHR